MFLTPTDLAALTGRTRSSAQIRWLSRAGMRYQIGADGRPRVLCAEVERHMLSGPARKREPSLRLVGL